MNIIDSAIAVYDSHEKAEDAVKLLQEAGIDLKTLSIAPKDTHTDSPGVEHASVSIGVPNNGVVKHEDLVKNDKFVVTVHGTCDDVKQAEDVLIASDHKAYTVHGETTYA